MANYKILKSINGNIWTKDNKIIRSRPFSEDVLQEGLVFWGASDPNYLTIVPTNKVSDMFDLRETNFITPTYPKMTQSLDANRPIYDSVYGIKFSSLQRLQSSISSTAKSFFMLVNPVVQSGQGGITNLNTFGGSALLSVNNKIPTVVSLSYFYQNLIKYQSNGTTRTTLTSLHTLTDTNYVGIVYLGRISAGVDSTNLYVKEIGWYNRILSEQEVIYNQNALMTKYNIV